MSNNKNHFYGILNNLVVLVSPIVIIPFVIKHLGLYRYGEFVQVNIIYSALLSIFIASLSGYFVKMYVENKLSFIFIFKLQVLISLFVTALLFLALRLFVGYDAGYVFLCVMLLNSFNFEWYFYAVSKQKSLFYRNVLIKSIFLISTILILPIYNTVQIYFLLYAANLIMTNIATGFFCLLSKERIYRKKNIKYEQSKLGNIVLDIKYFIASPAIGAIYQYGDQLLVGMLFTKPTLVFINLAKQIIGACVMVSGTLCRGEQKTLFSLDVSKRMNKIKKLATYFIIYLIVSSFMIIFLGPCLLTLVIKETNTLTSWYYMLIAGVFVFTSASIFQDYILGLTFRKEKYTLIANVGCAIIVTILNLFFLKKNGANFSLFSLLIGEFFVFVSLLIMHGKNIKGNTNG